MKNQIDFSNFNSHSTESENHRITFGNIKRSQLEQSPERIQEVDEEIHLSPLKQGDGLYPPSYGSSPWLEKVANTPSLQSSQKIPFEKYVENDFRTLEALDNVPDSEEKDLRAFDPRADTPSDLSASDDGITSNPKESLK